MNAEMRSLRDAEYDRLRTSIDLGGTLVHLRAPALMRPVLEQIIANGNTTLERVGDVADPYLLSNTRMTVAAAEYDLANIEDRTDARSAHVARGTRQCDAAVQVALDSGTTILSLATLPWALIVLTGGLRAARSQERASVETLMLRCANALPEAHDRQIRDRRRGAQTLFESQLLLLGARQLSDPIERGVVLQRAAEIARDARRVLLGSGDRTAAAHAKETLVEIEGTLSGLASAAAWSVAHDARAQTTAPAPSDRAAPTGYPKFCPSCGTPTTGRKFCTNCGARLGSASTDEQRG